MKSYTRSIFSFFTLLIFLILFIATEPPLGSQGCRCAENDQKEGTEFSGELREDCLNYLHELKSNKDRKKELERWKEEYLQCEEEIKKIKNKK